MIIETATFKCDRCGEENELPTDYDRYSGIAGIPMNDEMYCQNCIEDVVSDQNQMIQPDQMEQIKLLANQLKYDWPGYSKFDWGLDHTLNSWVFLATHMRTTNINEITKIEAQNIIKEETNCLAARAQWIRENPKCASDGCVLRSLGAEGSECLRCGKHYI